MINNEEGVLRRLDTLHRRSAALKSAVKQLVAEIEEERKRFGNVESCKKDVLKVRMRMLFDAKVRSRNLARNYKRKKDLQKIAEAEMERCGSDYDFDPSTVVVSPHQPPIFPVLPLPHRFDFQLNSYSHLASSSQQGAAANSLVSGMADAYPASPPH